MGFSSEFMLLSIDDEHVSIGLRINGRNARTNPNDDHDDNDADSANDDDGDSTNGDPGKPKDLL